MYLIDLYNDRAVNRIAEFAAVAEGLEISTLCQGYRELIQAAPRRHERISGTSRSARA